ncbi:hypothetical protein AB0N79_38490 [Streptomyces microflavus]|uniref:hypothetical protein n=1 Tax=Streptomyces microflavus TaxID=1919 RepID=UPI0029BC6F50|nr:hypothetical protein [Streptomyces microflavus]MDX2404597.1 hypothetical protein [Streptomyces microflavus]
MTLCRLSFLSAALLTTAVLAACTSKTVGSDAPKPTATGSTNPSGAPGGAPDGTETHHQINYQTGPTSLGFARQGGRDQATGVYRTMAPSHGPSA